MKSFQIVFCLFLLAASLSAQTLPTPTITPLGSTLSCNGNGLILQSSASSGNVWSNGQTTQTIHVMNTGTYNVTQVTGTNSSASSAAIHVSIVPSASISPVGPICITNGQANPVILNGQPQHQPPNIYGTFSNSQALNGNSFDPLKANLGSNNIVVYYILYNDSNTQCQDSASIRITVQNCTSLLEKEKQTDIKIFPNPGNGTYVLQTATDLTDIKFYNLIGQEVEALVSQKDFQYTFSLSAPPGVYVICYQSKGRHYSSQFVKE